VLNRPLADTRRDPSPADRSLDRLRRLAWWLDEGIRVPGTRFRIGLDPILGLVPGLGDSAGALMGVAILAEASRRGVPRLTLIRMVANIILDTALGSVPLIGDAFDAAWKANARNLRLLERHSSGPLEARRGDRLFVVGLFGLLVLVCAGLLLGSAALIGAVMKLLAGH
jgi:hypothetical protein